MAISVKYRQLLTGGAAIALDSILSSVINNDDLSFTVDASKIYAHKYDSSSTAVASSPSVIVPVDVPVAGRWLLQASPFDAVLLPLPGTLVTGDMYGLEYSYTSANSITVDAGICYDSLNTTVLTGSTTQVVTVGSVINTIYNLFLCDDGLVKTDTNVNGTTLLAGSVTALRWIGFVLTNSAGDVNPFVMSGDRLRLTPYITVGSLTTAMTMTDLSSFVPATRVSEASFGSSGLYSRLRLSVTGAQEDTGASEVGTYIVESSQIDVTSGAIYAISDVNGSLYMYVMTLKR